VIWRLTFVLLILIIAALASKKPVYELYFAPVCIEEIQQTAETYCHGPDKQNLTCPHLKMKVKVGCESLRVVK